MCVKQKLLHYYGMFLFVFLSLLFRPKRRSGYHPGYNFPEGRTKVSYEAKDRSGNRASCNIFVNVKGMYLCFPPIKLLN